MPISGSQVRAQPSSFRRTPIGRAGATPASIAPAQPTDNKLWIAAGVSDKKRRRGAFLSLLSVAPIPSRLSALCQGASRHPPGRCYLCRPAAWLRKPLLTRAVMSRATAAATTLLLMRRTDLDISIRRRCTPRGARAARWCAPESGALRGAHQPACTLSAGVQRSSARRYKLN